MSQDNMKRLQADVDASSMSKVCAGLEINIKYLSEYLNHGVEPTNNTPEGKRVREALGIVSKKLQSTRKSQAAREAIAQSMGYKSCSHFWTMATQGHRILLANPLWVGEGSGGE